VGRAETDDFLIELLERRPLLRGLEQWTSMVVLIPVDFERAQHQVIRAHRSEDALEAHRMTRCRAIQIDDRRADQSSEIEHLSMRVGTDIPDCFHRNRRVGWRSNGQPLARSSPKTVFVLLVRPLCDECPVVTVDQVNEQSAGKHSGDSGSGEPSRGSVHRSIPRPNEPVGAADAEDETTEGHRHCIPREFEWRIAKPVRATEQRWVQDHRQQD
jgi:hypothetical protein